MSPSSDGLPYNLDDLLHRRTIEDHRVEFKATWNDVIAESVLRSACAFANDLLNLNGGYIILGVEESAGRPILPPRGLAELDLDLLQKRITETCRRIEPAYQPMLFPVHVEEQAVLVLFCPGGDNRPYQARAGKGEGGRASYYVRLGPMSVEARDDTLRQLMEQAAKIPFDDRRSLSAGQSALSPLLVRDFLRQIGSQLHDEPIADQDLYRRLRIVVPVNAHEVPRNIGLLFFSVDPDRFFPGARVEVVRFPEGASGDVLEERLFRGPLPEQIDAALLHLGGLTGERVRMAPSGPAAIRTLSYPPGAVREALINALYHRSYEAPPEPVKVYLYPDRMEITSYPGPLAGLRTEHFSPGASAPNIPARNRRIGDFFKELRLCETRGTGIPKIYRHMRDAGSPQPRFLFDEERTYFTVRLPIHPEHALAETRRLRADGKLELAAELLASAFQRQPQIEALAQELMALYLERGQEARAEEVMRAFLEQERPAP